MKLWRGKPTLGMSYAIIAGDHVGQFFIFVKMEGSDYHFVSSPTMMNKVVPKKIFDQGLKTGIVKYIEKVPSFVRETVKAQFEYNEKVARTSE